jgi:hypothetical protein
VRTITLCSCFSTSENCRYSPKASFCIHFQILCLVALVDMALFTFLRLIVTLQRLATQFRQQKRTRRDAHGIKKESAGKAVSIRMDKFRISKCSRSRSDERNTALCTE